MTKPCSLGLLFGVLVLGPACTFSGSPRPGEHAASFTVVHPGAQVTIVHFRAPW